MKTNKNLLSIFFILLFCSCVAQDGTSKSDTCAIFNNSDSAIYLYITCKDSLPLYPQLNLFDTIIIKQLGVERDSIFSPDYRINAYKYYFNSKENDGNVSIEKNLFKCGDKKIRFYFIKESTMHSKNWTEIYKKQLYEKKMVIAVSEIKDLNDEIVYEP